MRIAVCDDEEQEISRIGKLIAEYQESRKLAMDCRFFSNGTDFLCKFKGGEFDLVVLDIRMPGFGGIQAAQELRELDRNVRLVFVSASPEFAVESYRVGRTITCSSRLMRIPFLHCWTKQRRNCPDRWSRDLL